MAITSSPARLLALSCASILAMGFAACGDDDKETSGGKPATPVSDASETTSEKPASDKEQIKALAVSVQKAFASGDGRVLCEGLTLAAQRDIVTYGRLLKAGGAPASCADVVRRVAESSGTQGIEQEPARVVAVRVRGDRAVALVRTASVAPVRQRYVREDGEWKLRPLGLAAAVRGSKGP